MKLSWNALILAPLPIPFIFSVLLEISAPGKSPILSFLSLFVLGSVLSYGVTVFFLLPCLFLVSSLTLLTARLTGLVGTVLGGLAWLAMVWIAYRASGGNSGPPQGSFDEYLWRELSGMGIWMFLMAGLVTAMTYRFLADQSHRGKEQPSP